LVRGWIPNGIIVVRAESRLDDILHGMSSEALGRQEQTRQSGGVSTWPLQMADDTLDSHATTTTLLGSAYICWSSLTGTGTGTGGAIHP
jgi:hypothetical protein